MSQVNTADCLIFPVFASGDELRCELVFQELPSKRTVDHLKPQHYLIRDIKFNRLSTSGILGSFCP
ncbi:hypothetical protein OROMI_018955 [Orobanche minor]